MGQNLLMSCISSYAISFIWSGFSKLFPENTFFYFFQQLWKSITFLFLHLSFFFFACEAYENYPPNWLLLLAALLGLFISTAPHVAHWENVKESFSKLNLP